MQHDNDRPTVNIIPTDIPLSRLLDLRDRYRRLLTEDASEQPPSWYSEQVLAQADRLLAERGKAVAE